VSIANAAATNVTAQLNPGYTIIVDGVQQNFYNSSGSPVYPLVYNGTTYEAFKITATWEYETDLGYDKSGTFYLIKDNDKLNIVEKQ